MLEEYGRRKAALEHLKHTLIDIVLGMTNIPTFVFVPGAWHGAATWEKVTPILDSHGYHSISVTLPSTAGDPTSTFSHDVQAVQTAILSATS